MKVQTMIQNGFSEKEIAEILRTRSEGGRKGGLKKGAKGLGAMDPQRSKAIQSLGGIAKRDIQKIRKFMETENG